MTKTITTDELERLTWAVESVEAFDHILDELDPEPVGVDEDGEWELEPRWNSWLTGLCILRAVESPEITYVIDWMAQGGNSTLADAHAFAVEVNETGENTLDTGSIEIVDEDGDPMTPSEAERLVGNDIANSASWEAAVYPHLPVLGIDTIGDIDEDDDMETFELARDDGPDVRFQGEQIAGASSFHHEGPRNTRWTELKLFRTKGGKLVCQEVGQTRWDGERTKYRLHFAESEAEMVEALGFGWLAKKLYEDAGIDHAQEIE